MATNNTSTVSFLFMRKYTDAAVENAATRDHPLSHMVAKKEDLHGEDFRYFVQYGNPVRS